MSQAQQRRRPRKLQKSRPGSRSGSSSRSSRLQRSSSSQSISSIGSAFSRTAERLHDYATSAADTLGRGIATAALELSGLSPALNEYNSEWNGFTDHVTQYVGAILQLLPDDGSTPDPGFQARLLALQSTLTELLDDAKACQGQKGAKQLFAMLRKNKPTVAAMRMKLDSTLGLFNLHTSARVSRAQSDIERRMDGWERTNSGMAQRVDQGLAPQNTDNGMRTFASIVGAGVVALALLNRWLIR